MDDTYEYDYYDEEKYTKEDLTNTLTSIEQFFKGKDLYEKDPVKFAELFIGGRLLPYQRLMLKAFYLKENINTIISRKIQKELSYTAKVRLIYAISSAILGQKILFMDANKNTNKNIEYITNFIDYREIFEENDVAYEVEKNIIRFNTGGSIEFN